MHEFVQSNECEGDHCASCDDMRLADVPAPVRPEPVDGSLYLDIPAPVVPALSGRRVARTEQRDPSLVGRHDDARERVALVHPDVARAVAVIAGHLDDAEERKTIEHHAGYWRDIAAGHWMRAGATVGVLRDEHEKNAKTAARRADFYTAILGLHAPTVDPKTTGEAVR